METVASRLKEVMRERKLRQVDILNLATPIAKEANVVINKSHISLYVNEHVHPQSDKIYVLAKALGVSEAWLLGYDVPKYPNTESGEDERDLNIIFEQLVDPRKKNVLNYAESQLREQERVHRFKDYIEEDLYGYASAGNGYTVYDNPIEKIIIPKTNVPSQPYDIVLEVSGDSMKPTFEDGEYVFIKKSKEIRNGQFGVFIINHESFLKKVYVDRDRLTLVSLNEEYPDLIFNQDDDIEMVRVVVI